MPEFEIYKSDEDGQHYWRLKSSNGQVIATGGEGYTSHAGAARAVGSIKGTVLTIAAEEAEAKAEEQAKIADE